MNYFEVFLTISNNFVGLSCLSWFISVYFEISWSISISVHLGISIFNSVYHELSWTISGYFQQSLLSIRVQLETGEVNLLLFQTFFLLLFFFSRASSRGARAPKNLTLHTSQRIVGRIPSVAEV